MQSIFTQTREEELREIEETINMALRAYDSAKEEDNEKMVQKASAVINAELERLEQLKFTNAEIKLTTENVQ